MEKPSLRDSRKKRHKSEFFLVAKAQGKQFRPKRLSCMMASQFLHIEESETQVANFLIEQILAKVFHSINQAKELTSICTQQLTEKLNLLGSYQMYTMSDMAEWHDQPIRPEQEPKIQPNFKVISRKDKHEQNYQTKDPLTQELNKTNSSNSKTKFNKKQKLLKVTNNLSSKQLAKSNHSIYSNKQNTSNSLSISYRYPKRIEQEIQDEKEKDKRLKEQIMKKLMAQYHAKLKENPHSCPQPLLQEYRSFFVHPQSKEQQNLRVSYLQLRQLRIAQEKLVQRKKFKKTSALFINAQDSERSVANSIHLPKIQKSNFGAKKQQSQGLFTQDDNGQAIRLKNKQRIETRQYSNTTHESYVKPRETALKQISNTYKPSVEYVKNDKIKDEASIFNENTSILSTLCHSMSVDEQMLDKSILENFIQKKGIMMKKSMCLNESPQPIDLSSLKLPSIKKRK